MYCSPPLLLLHSSPLGLINCIHMIMPKLARLLSAGSHIIDNFPLTPLPPQMKSNLGGGPGRHQVFRCIGAGGLRVRQPPPSPPPSPRPIGGNPWRNVAPPSQDKYPHYSGAPVQGDPPPNCITSSRGGNPWTNFGCKGRVLDPRSVII